MDILKHNSDHAAKHFLDTMYSLGLYPLIDRPSRITNQSSTLIDNIFTNAKEYNNVSGLLVNDITDHLPIFAFCDYPDLKRQEKKLHTKKRVINKNTIDLLADNLSEVDWDNVLNLSEVDLAYNAFLSTFVHLYNQCCPIRLVKHSSCKNDKPWLTNSLRNACHKKKLLYKKCLRSRTLTAEQKYKLYKNKLTTILRFAEKSYYSSLLVANRGDAKNTWNVLNTVINKKMCQNELPKHFECNGEDVSDTSIIANKFNNFVATIGPNLANALPAVEGASIGDYMGEHNINSMFLTPVVENEIINIVKLCRPKNSKDCDDISMYVISKVIVSIAKPLAHIFDLSFSRGIFPDHMKIAKIIPIFKNGQNTEFSNYRPISILSQFSKILEKLFNLRLE